jgi:hyaluronan synthase
MIPRAFLARRSVTLLAATALACLGIAWAARHAMLVSDAFHGRPITFASSWAFVFVLLAQQLALAWLERPATVTAKQQARLNRLRVTVNVPVHNEQPELLHRCLWSLLQQTRLPDRVQVVVNGCPIEPYRQVLIKWAAAASGQLRAEFIQVDQAGKRHAQATTFRDDDADIAVTIDSDTVLERRAIEEGLKPFADPRVQSVAGLELGWNGTRSLLTRLQELCRLTWQLTGRSALSTVGQCLVNCGTFALYRAAVIRDNLDAYLNETFAGRRVEISDDSLLVMFALARGRAVQQPTAFMFTIYPETVAHHLRQQVRWMRGAFIRSWWRLRYLPLSSYAYWAEFIGWVQFVLTGVLFVTLFVIWPLVERRVIPSLLVVSMLIGYAMALKLLLIRRTDQSRASQFATFALAPAMVAWNWLVLRPVRLWGMATCLNMRWGTRARVERTAYMPKHVRQYAIVTSLSGGGGSASGGIEATGAAPAHGKRRQGSRPGLWQIAAVTGVAGCIAVALSIVHIL